MKIMYLIFSFNIGGIERLLSDLMQRMCARDCTVSLCVINRDYDPAFLKSLDPRIRVILLDREPGKGNPLVYMAKLAEAVRENRTDILHCQGINCVLYAGLAKLLRPRLQVLNTVHDSGNYPSYSAAKIFLQNRICGMTIAISKSVEREILSRHMDPRRVTTIYNAVDTKRFALSGKLPGERTVIGNVARFFPKKKGQDTLAGAVLQLLGEDPSLPLTCVFAGAPAKGEEEALEEMKKSAADAGFAANFCFLGNVDDVPALLKTLDLFVLPSNYEGFGIALIEALSAGIPVIASNLEGPAEILSLAEKDGLRPGCLVPAGDREALAGALRAFLRREPPFDALSSPEELHRFVEARFGADAACDRHLSLYRSLL